MSVFEVTSPTLLALPLPLPSNSVNPVQRALGGSGGEGISDCIFWIFL